MEELTEESAIPRLFQLHGTSLCVNHISDPITSAKICFILYYTGVVAGSDMFVRSNSGISDAIGIHITARGLKNVLAAIRDIYSCDTARRLSSGVNYIIQRSRIYGSMSLHI